MIYRVQLNRRVHNIRVYNILKKKSGENAITRLFERIFVKKNAEESER